MDRDGVHDVMNIERVLQSVTSLIVTAVDPDEVVLFGSCAKGNTGPQSDVDLLVIGPFTGPRWRRGAELRGLLDRYPLRFDLHFFTRPEEQEERRNQHSWIATLRAGARVVYTRRAIAPGVRT
jgi:predicted nucleotidyltransferase